MKIAQKAQMMAAEARVQMAQQDQSFTEPFRDISSEVQTPSGSSSQEPPAADSSNIAVGPSQLDIYS